MPKLLTLLIFLLISVFIFSGCRPPELEGAYLHLKNERWDEALELAKKVTKNYPQNSEGWYTLGYTYGKKDSIEKMLDAYDKCMSIDNTHSKEIEAEKYEYYAKKYNLGAAKYNEYLKQQDPKSEEAITIMNESINSFLQSNLLKPNFTAVSLAAQGYNILGEKDKALKKYEYLVETYPDSASAWISMGKYYYNNKNYEEAIPYFIKATKIDSSDSEGFVFAAQSYDFLEKKDEAIPYYKTAVMLNEEDSAVSFNLGLLYYKIAIGTSDESEKNEAFNNAVEYFSLSLEYNSDFMSSYQLKGNAELLLKKYEDAKETLEIGTEKFPEDAQMWNDLAICYALLNESGKAAEAEARANELR